MSRYIVRLGAESHVRLNVKSHFDGISSNSIYVTPPGFSVALFDRFVRVGTMDVPSGLIIQAAVTADGIEEAIQAAGSVAVGMLNILSCASCASIARPIVLFAYDATQNIDEREFVAFIYDFVTPHSTRRPKDTELDEFIRKYDAFHCDPQIRLDHKDRVARALDAYRRALSDNDDLLTDFIVLWAAMEGMDCVYRTIFPSKQSQFKDGMRDAFARIGHGPAFATLEDLRNGIAHGNMSLATANQCVIANIHVVRQALLFMAMRIVKFDDKMRDQIVSKGAYKGDVVTHFRVQAKIRCHPGEVNVLENHPHIQAVVKGVEVAANGDSTTFKPEWQFNPSNIDHFQLVGVEVRGDLGGNLRVDDMGIVCMPSGDTPGKKAAD